MSRMRSLKPGLFENEVLAETGPEGMLLFAGLWTLADRQGRLEDRPKRIKAQVFPYFDTDVDTLLNALQSRGFLLRYAVNSVPYIEITTFTKHQRPHANEIASVIPAPEDAPRNAPDLLPRLQALATKDDSASALNGGSNGVLELEPEALPPLPPAGGTTKPPSRDLERFEQFWAVYPRKVAKQAAFQAWQKIKPDDALFDRILTAVTAQRRGHDWLKNDGEFIPHPATWLKQARWDDAVAIPRADPRHEPGPNSARRPGVVL